MSPDATAASAETDLKARQTLISILMTVVSVALWASADAFAKVMGDRLPVIEVAWMRFGIHVVFVFIYYRTSLAGVLNSLSLPMQIARGLCSAISGICFIAGLSYVPLAEATTIVFISPFMIMAMAAVFLKDKVGIRRWVAAGIGLLGVLLIVRPGSDAFQKAAIFPALAALFGSVAIILTRLLSKDGPMRTMFYTGTVGFFVLSVMTIFEWVPPTQTELLLALGMGLSASFANLTQITAYNHTKPGILAPFTYIQIVWAALLSMAFFEIWPTANTILGAAIIAGSGIYSALRERAESRVA